MHPIFTIRGFLLLVCICFFGCNGKQYPSGNEGMQATPLEDGESASPDEPVLRKGNLNFFILGRNQLEIEALLGVPHERDSENGNLVVWRYRRAVFDEATSITYGWSQLSLSFLRGLCSKVSVDLEQPPVPVEENTEVNPSSGSSQLPLFRKFQ